MIRLFLLCLLLSGCASLPETHRYTLVGASLPPSHPAADELPIVTVEELEVDSVYDDPRIAYRPSAYRFEYYHYHRWSAPPSLLVTEYFRDAFARSGRFARVTRALIPQANAVLRGRITAFEEIDVSTDRWIGRVALELFLEEPTSGKILWSRRFDEREPLAQQSPAGLARALSTAMNRIVRQTLPAASRIATAERRAQQEARLNDHQR